MKEETLFDLAVTRPDPHSGLGFASCAREFLDVAIRTLAPPEFPNDVPRGDSQTALLIPGFLAGDWTLLRLRDFLVHLGYRAEFAGVAVNLGPTRGLIPQLEHAVERLYTDVCRPISLVGQSLGASSRAASRTGTRTKSTMS